MISFRIVCWSCSVACLSLLGFALYLQHVQQLDPCPLCIFQRVVFIALATVGMVAGIHNPVAGGRRAYALVALLLALGGAGLAARHVWLQHFPELTECGAGLEIMLEQFPLTEVFSLVLRGSGECSDVLWVLLGLSIPEWTLVVFLLFTAVAAWLLLRRAEA